LGRRSNRWGEAIWQFRAGHPAVDRLLLFLFRDRDRAKRSSGPRVLFTRVSYSLTERRFLEFLDQLRIDQP